MEKKEKKKRAEKESQDVLKILIPDQLKRINENSGWCGTVKPDVNTPKKQKTFEF